MAQIFEDGSEELLNTVEKNRQRSKTEIGNINKKLGDMGRIAGLLLEKNMLDKEGIDTLVKKGVLTSKDIEFIESKGLLQEKSKDMNQKQEKEEIDNNAKEEKEDDELEL